jgi:GT2 family glycosyltransferase
MNISILIGLKNTLEYTKLSYNNIRDLYPEVEICYVSFGSTDNTHEWIYEIAKTDKNIKYFISNQNKTLSDTYNKAASISTKEYIILLHNDIILAPLFIENILKHINKNTIVSYTTIEPPIFTGHERDGKIIRDFGSNLLSFNNNDLCDFVKEEQKNKQNQISQGWAWFSAIDRELFLETGGFDNLFSPMFCEDDDFYIRLKNKSILKFIVSLDAICYHFVSKTSRFSEEYQQHTQQIELQSNRNFIRKWGNKDFKVKYDIGYIIKNCNIQLISTLELFASTIYVDCLYQNYINAEQSNTKFDLNKRIKNINEPKTNQILVEFDATQLNQNNFQLLQQLPQIISESGGLGTFELDIFKIDISGMDRLEKHLIEIDSPYYQSQLL